MKVSSAPSSITSTSSLTRLIPTPPSSVKSPSSLRSLNKANTSLSSLQQQTPPPTISSGNYVPINASILRSSELLSCARTAYRIQLQKQLEQEQAENNEENKRDPKLVKKQISKSLEELQLWDPSHHQQEKTAAQQSIQDSLALLSYTSQTISKLESLVKQRGHVNDPTSQIQSIITEMETLTKELMDSSQGIALHGRSMKSNQRVKHYELVSQIISKEVDQTIVKRFKKALEVRSEVIKTQAKRRKMLDTGKLNVEEKDEKKNGADKKKKNYHSQLDSPLFTMTGPMNQNKKATNGAHSNGSTSNGTASYGYSNGSTSYGYGSAGTTSYGNTPQQSNYYGNYNSYYNQGIRRRNTQQQAQQQYQQQAQIQTPSLDTEYRLEQAEQAERSLSQLTTMFHKMSNLISIQQEQIDKIEDDVEMAHGDITLGSQEIQKLFEVTKGNRGLIIKVFALLIVMILFFRLY